MEQILKEIPITDIENIKIGHAQDYENATGCTVILCEKGAPPAWTCAAAGRLRGRRSF